MTQINLSPWELQQWQRRGRRPLKKWIYITFERHNCVDLLSTPIGLKACLG